MSAAFELPVSVLNRPVYNPGAFNGELFSLCARPGGATIGELRKLADGAGTALALAFEPLCKHSRPNGKRGYRWDVLIDGKIVNEKSAFSVALLNALKTGTVRIANVRPTAGVYIDSMGVTKTADRVAAIAPVVPAPVVPAPVVPAPVVPAPVVRKRGGKRTGKR